MPKTPKGNPKGDRRGDRESPPPQDVIPDDVRRYRRFVIEITPEDHAAFSALAEQCRPALPVSSWARIVLREGAVSKRVIVDLDKAG
jgi:hypothetical protein